MYRQTYAADTLEQAENNPAMVSQPHIIVASIPELASEFARLVSGEAFCAVEARGRYALAIPGGSAAEAFLPTLAGTELPWRQTHMFWTDERAVAITSPDSNAGLARRLMWHPGTGPPNAKWHAAVASAPTVERGAAAYARDLLSTLGSPPVIDTVLLGVGPDGHVCSLFPDHPLLQERDRWVAAVSDSPKPPAARVTLTLAALYAARHVVIAAFGESKAAVVAAALGANDSRLPLALVAAGAHRVTWLLDPAAAAGRNA